MCNFCKWHDCRDLGKKAVLMLRHERGKVMVLDGLITITTIFELTLSKTVARILYFL